MTYASHEHPLRAFRLSGPTTSLAVGGIRSTGVWSSRSLATASSCRTTTPSSGSKAQVLSYRFMVAGVGRVFHVSLSRTCVVSLLRVGMVGGIAPGTRLLFGDLGCSDLYRQGVGVGAGTGLGEQRHGSRESGLVVGVLVGVAALDGAALGCASRSRNLRVGIRIAQDRPAPPHVVDGGTLCEGDVLLLRLPRPDPLRAPFVQARGVHAGELFFRSVVGVVRRKR